MTAAHVLRAAVAAAAPPGYIENFAGGGVGVPALATSIGQNPAALAVYGSNIYIADSSAAAIRVVSMVTGIETVVAGTGRSGYSGDGGPATQAQLSGASGIAVDGAGNLLVADLGNYRVRRISSTTGVITTVAGNGTRGFSGDGAAATSAQLGDVYAIAVDGAGNIYLADYSNYRVRKVSAGTGVITTIGGDGTYGNTGDGGPAIAAKLGCIHGVAVDGAGNVAIADRCQEVVRRIAASTGIITRVVGDGFAFPGDGGQATAARLDNPTSVAFDAGGNLLFADEGRDCCLFEAPGRVGRADAITGIVTTLAGGTYGANFVDGVLGTASSVGKPRDIAVDAAGNVFIAAGTRVRRVSAATSVIATIAGNDSYSFSGDGGPATSAQFSFMSDVEVAPGGNVFVADTYNDRVRRISAVTGIVTTIAGDGTFGFFGDGGPATLAQLAYPTGVAIAPNGDVLIADSNNHRIRRVSAATGIISTIAGNGTEGFSGDGGPATSAAIQYPFKVAIDSDGDVLIADSYNYRVRRVDAVTGIITTVAGNGDEDYDFDPGGPSAGDGGLAVDAPLNEPLAVAFDASGDLLISDTYGRIRRVSRTTGIITTLAREGDNSDNGSGVDLALDALGRIFVTDPYYPGVSLVDRDTGGRTYYAGSERAFGNAGDGGPALEAEFGELQGLAVDLFGNLLIADGTRLRIVFGPCGDAGVNYPGEECDQGAANGAGTTCCTSLCRLKTNGAACADDGNPCTTDSCNGVNPTCSHPAGNAGALCRASAGACDVAETCSGGSVNCPPNGFVSGGICRVSQGVCDVAETCSGTSAQCPPNQLVPLGTTCRAASSACDVAESCNGSSAACPTDGVAPIDSVCRAPAGGCDLAEKCSGASKLCPADGFVAAGTVCAASTGVCDAADVCSGSSASCPASAPLPDRDGDGVCNKGDNCADAFNPDQRDADASGKGDVCDACPAAGNNADCDREQTAAATVRSEGGTVTVPSGEIQLTVPPTALAAPTSVSVTGGLSSSGYGLKTSDKTPLLAEFEPSGVIFNPPVTVTFRWTDRNDNCFVDDPEKTCPTTTRPPGVLCGDQPASCDSALRESRLQIWRNGKEYPAPRVFCENDLTSPPSKLLGCDIKANTWTIAAREFSEYVLGEASCSAQQNTDLQVTNLQTAPGDEKVRFVGRFTIDVPIVPALDPIANGMSIVVETAKGDVILAQQLAGGARDPGTNVGWKKALDRETWLYKGKPPGVKDAKVSLLSAAEGKIKVNVVARGLAAPVLGAGELPLKVRVYVDGRCGDAAYPGPAPAPRCRFNGEQSRVDCD